MSATARSIHVDFAQVLDDEGHLDPVGHDLLSLTREAFLADRETPRGTTPDDPRWQRTLRVTVATQQPDRWRAPDVSSAVTTLLNWLSDDHWEVTWIQGPKPGDHGQSRFPLADTPREVMLFSGGLDAVAGAAHLLPTHDVEAVAVYSNRVMQGYQRKTVAALRGAKLGSLEFHQIDFSVQGGKRDSEPTRRTRGLVFLGLGAAMTMRRRQRRFVMAENGIGALNLPLTKAQSGAMTSRSAHPRTLKLFEDVLQLVTQESFEVHTPLLAKTKGEALRLIPESAREACAASESCDLAAAGRGRLRRRCGYCSSCVLRRMSFRAAGRADWDHPVYLADTQPHDLRRDQEPEMLWQVAVLDRALRDESDQRLRNEFPDLGHVPHDALSAAGQRRLLTQYVNEWREQPRPAVPRFLPPTPLAG